MKNNKFHLLFIAISINLFFARLAVAQEVSKVEDKYPDYNYEFIGKDKFENFNRKMFVFNSKLNKFVVKPVNIVWSSIMPKYGIDRIHSMYGNIEYPRKLICCLAQGEFKNSGKATLRFLTNSTLGLGGMFDPAKKYFKLEPVTADSEKVLAHYNVKSGPYLVLPGLPPATIRGMGGRALDIAMEPTTYIAGPVPRIIKAASYVDKTTSLQSLINSISSTYADPYDITKKACGIESYLRTSGLIGKDVWAQMVDNSSEQTKQTPYFVQGKNIADLSKVKIQLKPDVKIDDFKAQSPLVDSMRTAFFDAPDIHKSHWNELSIWNRSFAKRIKTSSVNVEPGRDNYTFRYILQKDKKAPLAILLPSLGENANSHHSIVLSKIFFDQGYSVIMVGNAFQWQFVKSMPKGYFPGVPSQDAHYMRLTLNRVLQKMEDRYNCKFEQKVAVGTSFGALTTLFIASQEQQLDTLGISNYISINPPIDSFYALKELDRNSQDWRNSTEDVKQRVAIVAAKVMQLTQYLSSEETKKQIEMLPFDDEEAKLIIGFIMKQKLSDIIFTIEDCPKCRKNKLASDINNSSYYDYAQKYLISYSHKPADEVTFETSLYSIRNYLKTANNFKIYHALDDFFVNQDQLSWLKNQTGSKSIYFSNGSHLGFLYKDEFLNQFKKDIAQKNTYVKAQI